MSIYEVSTLGTADNQITFNNYTEFPIYRVQARAPQARLIRDLDIPIPFESGISDFQTLVGKMAYVIEGKMYPSGEADYSTGLAALRKLANLEVQQNDNNSDFGYVPYIFSDNGTNNRQIFLKVLYVDIREDTKQGLIQPFKLVCKIKDPTIYGYPIKSASTEGTAVEGGAGAAVFPFSFPVVFGASTFSVTASANNAGTLPVFPASLVIVGPVNVPRITNVTTGEYIEVDENLATGSAVLTITYDKDTLTVELNGDSVLGSVSSGSTFFKLQSGENQIELSGTSIGDDAYVEVNFYDGYALS